jgi:ribose 1,5-bisphosphate isomerase
MAESLDSLIRSINSLEIQGAKQIAVQSLKFLREYAKTNGFGKEFDRVADRIERTRPTAVVLHNCLEIVRKNRSEKTINNLLGRLSKSTNEIAKRGSRLIRNKQVIMTHCHSGEALSVIKQAWKDGKRIRIYATETRPKEQGVTTALELAQVRIPVTLITDAAAGFFIKEVDAVIVGSDAIRKEGFVNKIGTYVLAVLAKENKIPFYVVGNTLKLDSRKKITIEERSAGEIIENTSLGVRNPAFDMTPWKYVKRVVTEKGVMTPGNVLKLLKKSHAK